MGGGIEVKLKVKTKWWGRVQTRTMKTENFGFEISECLRRNGSTDWPRREEKKGRKRKTLGMTSVCVCV